MAGLLSNQGGPSREVDNGKGSRTGKRRVVDTGGNLSEEGDGGRAEDLRVTDVAEHNLLERKLHLNEKLTRSHLSTLNGRARTKQKCR